MMRSTTPLAPTAGKPRRRLGYLLLATCLGALAGCKSTGVSWTKATHPMAKKNAVSDQAAQSPAGVPERLVVIWKDSIYEHPTQPATRGFGGRVYFYDKEDQPVRVDGELVVYGFDDTAGAVRNEADKKFVFQRESLPQHFSVTGLGPSYSVWVPWDPLGSPEANICLIPVFRDASGKIVRGGQTVCVLAGPDTDSREMAADKPATPWEEMQQIPGVQQIATGDEIGRQATHMAVAHLTESESAPPTQKAGAKIRSTTIALPNDTAMRLQQASRRLAQTQMAGTPQTANESAGRSAAGSEPAPLTRNSADGSSQRMASVPDESDARPADSADALSPRSSSRGVFGLPGSLK